MFEVGDIIRFRYTGVKGEIVEDHTDGTYTVLDIDDEETIAFADDIILDEAFKQVEQSEIQQKMQKKPKGLSTEEMFYSKDELDRKYRLQRSQKSTTKKDKVSEKIQFPTITPTKPTHQGCFLAFVPFSPTHYSIYLINDTAHSFSFEFRLYLHDTVIHGFDKLIPAFEFFSIGEFRHEQFNDRPKCYLNFPRLRYEKSIKLKYKKFQRSKQAVPLMGIESYLFPVFDKFPPSTNKSSKFLLDYTLEKQENADTDLRPVRKYYRKLDLMDYASFSREIDLHAEKLVNDTSEYTPAELFKIQLEVLDHYILKAIELDVDTVYIVHGLGSGRLKKAVAKYLRYKDNVKDYKNEYHERYGFGATAVHLR